MSTFALPGFLPFRHPVHDQSAQAQSNGTWSFSVPVPPSAGVLKLERIGIGGKIEVVENLPEEFLNRSLPDYLEVRIQNTARKDLLALQGDTLFRITMQDGNAFEQVVRQSFRAQV